METFVCTKCEEPKPADAFRYRRKDGRSGYRVKMCRACEVKETKEYMKSPKGRETRRRYHQKFRQSEAGKAWQKRRYARSKESGKQLRGNLKKFGLTLEDFNRMSEQQNGLCAICRNPPVDYERLSVDHCHTSGKVRALLCARCNSGLGYFYEDTERLEAAINYLKEHSGEASLEFALKG